MTRKSLCPELALRPYLPSDFATLACWYGEAPEWAGNSNVDRSRMGPARSEWRLALGGHTLEEALPTLHTGFPGLLMLEDGAGTPVGFVSAEERNTSAGKVLWIRVLLIDPARRHHGYGGAAVSKLISICQGRSPVRRVLLAVDADNESGLAFWQTLGFSELRRVKSVNPGQPPVRILALACPHP